MKRNCKNYDVYVIDDKDLPWYESEICETVDEARSMAADIYAGLTLEQRERFKIWIQGWNGDEFPEEGADYEEEFCAAAEVIRGLVYDGGHASQEAFAEKYGIPARTFAGWCTGSRVPPAYVVDLLVFAERNKKEMHVLKSAFFRSIVLWNFETLPRGIKDEDFTNYKIPYALAPAVRDLVDSIADGDFDTYTEEGFRRFFRNWLKSRI